MSDLFTFVFISITQDLEDLDLTYVIKCFAYVFL